jgi:hypothetical protein
MKNPVLPKVLKLPLSVADRNDLNDVNDHIDALTYPLRKQTPQAA